jgi:hypothetical protein
MLSGDNALSDVAGNLLNSKGGALSGVTSKFMGGG